MDKDHLRAAQEAFDEYGNTDDPGEERSWLRLARIHAAIAQAEQLQRIATATERRNELLAEFNEQSKTSAIAHTEKIAESVNAFLDAHFDKDEES